MSANQETSNKVRAMLNKSSDSDHESTFNAAIRFIEDSTFSLDEASKELGISAVTFGKWFKDSDDESVTGELSALAKATGIESSLWHGRRYLKTAVYALKAKLTELRAGKERIRTTTTAPKRLVIEFATAKGITQGDNEEYSAFVERLASVVGVNSAVLHSKLNAIEAERQAKAREILSVGFASIDGDK